MRHSPEADGGRIGRSQRYIPRMACKAKRVRGKGRSGLLVWYWYAFLKCGWTVGGTLDTRIYATSGYGGETVLWCYMLRWVE